MLAVAMLALACTDDPKPVPPTRMVKPTRSWTLEGRVTPNVSSFPDAPPFQGGKTMIADCGEQRPCAAERWKTDNGDTLDMVRIADKMKVVGDPAKWNARWRKLSGTLHRCIGDPLSVPPTTELAAFRTLETSHKGDRWIIHMFGQNQCGLSGTLSLDAHKDLIDTDDLLAGGAPWKQGGRDAAKTRLSAFKP